MFVEAQHCRSLVLNHRDPDVTGILVVERPVCLSKKGQIMLRNICHSLLRFLGCRRTTLSVKHTPVEQPASNIKKDVHVSNHSSMSLCLPPPNGHSISGELDR